jgi:hypothetical protein
MKTIVKLLSLVFIMGLFSCSNDPLIDVPEESITADQSFEKKSKAKNSTVKVMDMTGYIKGTVSTVHRKSDGIKVKFMTRNLIPGNAYTLWFVIFGEDGPPPTGPPPTFTYAGGLVVGKNGKANFSAHKSVGEMFDNPLTAEIHLALRTHGPAIPGMTELQITTMDGGCTSGFPSGPGLNPDSDVEGYCANVQVAIHKVE